LIRSTSSREIRSLVRIVIGSCRRALAVDLGPVEELLYRPCISYPRVTIIRAQGERASRRFIEFFTANIRNRNTRIVLDAFSRRIVGWAMETHLRTELVLQALNLALWQRRPAAVIHYSDQGSQYTSLAFGQRCREAGVRPSMEFLRHARMRAARPPPLQNPKRGPHGGLRVHRRLV
jgi:transposase InsO family protein